PWFYEGGDQFRLGASHGSRSEYLEWVRQNPHQRFGRPFFRQEGPWRVNQIEDVRQTEPYRAGDPVWVRTADQEGMRTLLGVPLVKDGRLIGSIAVYRREVKQFTDAQVQLVQTFADQAVIAIENVRLFKELEQRNREVTEALEQQTATGDILRVISSSPTDVQPVFETIAQRAKRLCDARQCAVFTFDGALIHLVALADTSETWAATLRGAFPRPPGRRSFTARAIQTRPLVHIPDRLTYSD